MCDKTMREYIVKIDRAARVDMLELRIFLMNNLSLQGAIRYANAMRAEVESLGIYADLFRQSTSKQLQAIHPRARHMPSHNKRWQYIFHIEGKLVVVDRILQAKHIKEL